MTTAPSVSATKDQRSFILTPMAFIISCACGAKSKGGRIEGFDLPLKVKLEEGFAECDLQDEGWMPENQLSAS